MKKYLVPLTLTLFVFTACETEVDPDLDASLNILVVDAWLTDNDPVQHINITRSQPYFSTSSPSMVSGATVVVTDLNDNTTFVFEEEAERYTWESTDGTPFGVVGHDYALLVEVDGNTYTSTTSLNPVPPVDSISFVFEEGNALC